MSFAAEGFFAHCVRDVQCLATLRRCGGTDRIQYGTLGVSLEHFSCDLQQLAPVMPFADRIRCFLQHVNECRIVAFSHLKGVAELFDLEAIRVHIGDGEARPCREFAT